MTLEPVHNTRRTWLLAALAFVLLWAWVLVAQQRIEARHPETGPAFGRYQPAVAQVGHG